MWDLDVVTVVAAGNSGNTGHSLDETLPQKLGTLTNGLISWWCLQGWRAG
jgi:hypothetical protein